MSKGGKKGGLAFLETKSWAMNNPVMVAKMAQAENKDKAEMEKAKEVMKEREKERQKELIKKQQIESGHIEAGVDRMDWMYERPPGLETTSGVDSGSGGQNQGGTNYNTQFTAQQREDFLLGKATVATNQHLTLKNVLETDKERVWDKASYQSSSSAAASTFANQQDHIAMLRRDPLLMALDLDDDDDYNDYDRKRKEKKEKGEKKDKKDKKKHRDYDDDDRRRKDHSGDRDRTSRHYDRDSGSRSKDYGDRDRYYDRDGRDGSRNNDSTSSHRDRDRRLDDEYNHNGRDRDRDYKSIGAGDRVKREQQSSSSTNHTIVKPELNPHQQPQQPVPRSTKESILGVTKIPIQFQHVFGGLVNLGDD